MIHSQDPEFQYSGIPDSHTISPEQPRFEVIVPVFMKVSLCASESLAAEVIAQEVIRSIGKFSNPSEHGGVFVEVVSVISPIVSPNLLSTPS